MTDFLEAIASAITVHQLETPMEKAMWFAPSACESDVVREMKLRDFDYAPVVDGGRVVGRIARAGLDVDGEQPIEDAVVPLHDGIVVSSESQIDHLVEWFAAEQALLVLDGRDITGLVTVSDLNKQAARTYFYAVVAGFEIALANRLRGEIEDQEAMVAELPEKRQSRIREDYASAGAAEADYLSAMYLPDLLEVARVAGLSTALGFRSRNAWESETGDLVEFRGAVAHPTRPILTRNADIERISGPLATLERLYEALTASSNGGSG